MPSLAMSSSQILFGTLRDKAPELDGVPTEKWGSQPFQAGSGALNATNPVAVGWFRLSASRRTSGA